MSVGETVYTSDDRVVVTHKKHSTDWILQFKFAKERDEGVYECQVIRSSTSMIKHYIRVPSNNLSSNTTLHELDV